MGSDRRQASRREFLTSTAGLALGLGVAPSAPQAAPPPDLAVISGEPAAATRKALETLGGMARFVARGQRVVLKPNMSFANPPEMATTTHPAVVATVAQACLEAGADRVLVMDHTLRKAEICMERTGILEACRPLKGVHVLGPDERKFFREVAVPQGRALKRIEVYREVLESPVLINLPQAKSHSTTGVSLGIKGLMGLIWDRMVFHWRYDINEALADLASVLRPQLTLLDATRALTTGGPGGPGEVVHPRLIVAGTDPVAVDAYGVSVAPWYGRRFTGRQVEHLVAAERRGLGRIDVERLTVVKGSA